MIIRVSFSAAVVVCLSVGFLGTDLISSSYAAQGNSEAELQKNLPSIIDGKISNTISVPGYTYVEVETSDEKVWAAVPGSSVNIGDEVSFSTGTPMQNFYSKSLQREFPVIYFVERFITNNGATTMSAEALAAHGQFGQIPTVEPVNDINKVEGGNTIAEIYARKDELNGDTIRVRGQVTKFTAGVMNTNWIRIRDGSTAVDLVVPTDTKAAVNDIVLAEGKLVINMDLGQGYVIPAVLEDAEITIE